MLEGFIFGVICTLAAVSLIEELTMRQVREYCRLQRDQDSKLVCEVRNLRAEIQKIRNQNTAENNGIIDLGN